MINVTNIQVFVSISSFSKSFRTLGNLLYLFVVTSSRAIRQRIIECFERASNPTISEKERERLLHFVVVGGGPTSVEFSAELYGT
jgi:NADH:ubiquinone reductase (non-electrogenic)